MGEVVELKKRPKPTEEYAYWICPSCDCREMHLSTKDGTLYINCAECEQEIIIREAVRLDVDT